uniref:Protein kinase domain-containing protein n=1 Tax=Neogobius melanostomus TaxID=47308 RepID=A0A8C6T967_9GOBI
MYTAPEVVQRRPYWSAADMWALGVITFIVLSGSVPFEDDSRARLCRAVTKGKYSFSGDPWPCVSNLAKDFISRLLRVEPGARLTADQALLHPWVASEAPTSSSKNLSGHFFFFVALLNTFDIYSKHHAKEVTCCDILAMAFSKH